MKMAFQLRALLPLASRQYRVICLGHQTLARSNHQQSKEAHVEVEPPYGYEINEDGDLKRSKDTLGMNRIGFVRLPDELENALQLFYKRQPRKRLTQDGQQIHRHLLNRGRPVHNTWKKFKEEQRAKSARRVDVKNFSVDEAVEEGLVDDFDTDEPLSATEEDNHDQNEAEVDSNQRQQTKKKPQLTQYSMIRYGSRESAAYTASQPPAVYGATLRAFNEIKRLAPDYQPRTMLDFGSGTGMSVWAGNSTWGNSIKEYQCVDVSDHMNDIAEFLLRGGSSKIEDPLVIPGVYFKKFLPLSNRIMYDVVVAAYSLTEMPFRQQRLQAIKSLWRKTNHFLVLVEPGNNEGFDTNLLARRYISEDLPKQAADVDSDRFEYDDDLRFDFDYGDLEEDLSGHIFAPCPHEMVCARTFVETRDHPCNFEQKVQLSFAQRNTHLKQYGYYNERFSYIIFKKGEKPDEEMNWTRVLQPIKKRKKHVICELCCSNGNIEKHILTKKKDPAIYKAARHCLHWGDMMPLDEAKRPMNIRKPIPPK